MQHLADNLRTGDDVSRFYFQYRLATAAFDLELRKQNLAPALDLSRARQNLHAVLTLLRLEPPPALRHEAVRTQLDWATPRWSLAALQGCRSLPMPERLAD